MQKLLPGHFNKINFISMPTFQQLKKSKHYRRAGMLQPSNKIKYFNATKLESY